MPRSTFDLRLDEHARDPRRKAAYTDRLFTDVAPVYDRFILGPATFFQDARWKRWMLDHLPPIPDGPVVDLATGTGGIAFRLAEKYPARPIIGVDINDAMLRLARERNRYASVTFRTMNLGDLAFGAGSVALVTGGYALRNSPDLDRLLHDTREMLMPEGVAAFLDISKASFPPLRIATTLGLRVWLSLWSLVLHGNLRIYTYIPASLRYYPDRRELGRRFDAAGFDVVRRKLCMAGIAEVAILRRRG